MDDGDYRAGEERTQMLIDNLEDEVETLKKKINDLECEGIVPPQWAVDLARHYKSIRDTLFKDRGSAGHMDKILSAVPAIVWEESETNQQD